MTTPLSQLEDYQLVDRKQDIRGWPLRDVGGKTLGRVEELMVDTAAHRVASVVLDSGLVYAVEEISLGDDVVVLDDGQPAGAAPEHDPPSVGAVESAARVRLSVMRALRSGETPRMAEDDIAVSGPPPVPGDARPREAHHDVLRPVDAMDDMAGPDYRAKI